MLEIRVRVLQRETKAGKKFDVYKAIQKNGTMIDLKFRREVANPPKVDCILLVEKTKCNMAKNTVYPTLWVNEIKEIKPFEKVERVDPEVLDLFDTAEDVPF